MYRRNIGTYPKWLARFIKLCIRFIFKTILRRKVEIVLRGRGKRPLGCRQDLPISLSKKVALYLTIEKRKVYYNIEGI